MTVQGQERADRIAAQGQDRADRTAQAALAANTYSRAVEQLASTTPDVRVGGIYSLAALRRGAPEYGGQVCALLHSYVVGRNHPSTKKNPNTPGFDVIAALQSVSGTHNCWVTEQRFHGLNLNHLSYPYLHAEHLWLADADLSGAILIWGHLSDANLRGANMSEANLAFADLRGANLSEANLASADLTGANLSDANLQGADLSRASLDGARLNNVRYDVSTRWPRGSRIPLRKHPGQ
jgi:uncharacterized protein YjbI with pentapeptide repeats